MEKSDRQLKQDVEDELRWDPRVNAAQLTVSTSKGSVALHGIVDTYAEKWCALSAARRVTGVRSVTTELSVKVLAAHRRSDSDIAAAIHNALAWDVFVPSGVSAHVRQGVVTLEGQATWNYERDAAEQCVRHLMGVVAVRNDVTLKTVASAAQVKEKVRAALQRQAKEDTESIVIEASGGKVTLTGHAASWQSIEDAANAAWAAPGVTQVLDQIKMGGPL